MARLWEIVWEKGVEVLGYDEWECCRLPRLCFHYGEFDTLKELTECVEDNGYEIARFHETFEYDEEGTGLPWSYG